MTQDNNTEDSGWIDFDLPEYWNHQSRSTYVDCPFCDIGKGFDDEIRAHEWYVGHIQVAHTDNFPALD